MLILLFVDFMTVMTMNYWFANYPPRNLKIIKEMIHYGFLILLAFVAKKMK